jgi:hypothetical protein
MPEPYYATADDLRAELDVDDTVLSDAAAIKLIEDAEDVIDSMLGARPVDDTTGRKVVQADVESWRFVKLTRATVKVAARLSEDPTILTAQYTSVSGPDFSFSGRISTTWGSVVENALTLSGLARLTTSIGCGRGGRPPWDDFAINRDPDSDYQSDRTISTDTYRG